MSLRTDAFEREHHDGMCNDPRPHNWREACVRVAGHRGPHYASGRSPVFWDADRDYMEVGDILAMLDAASGTP